MSQGAAATVVKTVVRPVTVEAAVVDLAVATAAQVAPVAEAAADSAQTAAASVAAVVDSVAEVAAVSALPVGKCSTRFAPNVARKRKYLSSPADHVPSIAEIASRPIAPHVVAVVAAAVVDSAAVVAADSVAVAATVVVAATAVPVVTKLHPEPVL